MKNNSWEHEEEEQFVRLLQFLMQKAQNHEYYVILCVNLGDSVEARDLNSLIDSFRLSKTIN